jgi:hypothetical protein
MKKLMGIALGCLMVGFLTIGAVGLTSSSAYAWPPEPLGANAALVGVNVVGYGETNVGVSESVNATLSLGALGQILPGVQSLEIGEQAGVSQKIGGMVEVGVAADVGIPITLPIPPIPLPF